MKVGYVVGILLVGSILMSGTVCLAGGHEFAEEQGKYYWLMSGVTFFINSPDGVGFDIDLAVKDIKIIGRGPLDVVVKLEDPDGHLRFRKELAPVNPKPPVADTHERARLLRSASRFVRDRKALEALPSQYVKVKVPGGKPGVYRLTVMGTWDNVIRLSLSKPLKYGLMSQSNHLAGISGDYAQSYIYIPRDSTYIDLWIVEGFAEDDCSADTPLRGGRKAVLSTLDGQVIAEINDETGRAAEIGATKFGRQYRPTRFYQQDVEKLADKVLKLSIGGGEPFKLHMAMGYKRSMYVRGDSFNAVLCPDEETARAIHGGATYYPTGGMAFNPWQKRMYDYLSKTKVDDYRLRNSDGSILEMKISEDEWTRAGLINRFFPIISPCGNGSAVMSKLPQAIEDVLASMSDPTDMHELFWKAPLPQGIGFYLGYFYSHPFEGNPLYHHPAALNLCLLDMCRLWMSMGLGNQACSPQIQGISVAYDMGGYWPYWEVARFVADDMPLEMKDILREAMFACGDRVAHDFFMHYNNMNQVTCIPMRLYAAYLTTGDDRLKHLARRLLHSIIDGEFGADSGQTASGDYTEGWAHDTIYSGYSILEVGRYYLLTRDPKALESLQRAYRFFNYIIMPDGSNPDVWASRVGMNVQFWGEGYHYLAALLPEAARYVTADGPLPGNPPKWQAGVKPPKLAHDVAFTVCDWKGLKRAEWAGLSPIDFTTDINNGHEFYAVKRRAYYALVFAGRLAPTNGKSLNGMGGGGLALVWTPDAGPVVMGKVLKEYGSPVEQWRDFQANGMVGSYSGGLPLVAHSCSEPSSKLDGSTLTIAGPCRKQPFRIERNYEFNDSSIAVTSTLFPNDRADRKHQIEELYEAIPIASAQAELFNKDGRNLGSLKETLTSEVASIRVGSTESGMIIRLDQPRPVQLSGKRTLFIKLPDGDALYGNGGIRASYIIEMCRAN